MIDFGCLYYSISNKRSAFPTNETAFFVPKNIKYDYSRITESYYVHISNLTRTNRHTMSPQIWRRHSGKILASQSTPGLLESRFPTNADSDSILGQRPQSIVTILRRRQENFEDFDSICALNVGDLRCNITCSSYYPNSRQVYTCEHKMVINKSRYLRGEVI